MKQILTLLYALGAAAFSVYAVINELQPALFWISLFAEDVGDTYPLLIVGLLTFITLLLPLVITLLIKRMLPEKPQLTEGPGVWIIRERQLQSALVEIPIYVNDKKAGGIAMGKIKFFPAAVGGNALAAGKGISKSETASFNCKPDEQLYFKLRIEQNGLTVKNVLQPIDGNPL